MLQAPLSEVVGSVPSSLALGELLRSSRVPLLLPFPRDLPTTPTRTETRTFTGLALK